MAFKVPEEYRQRKGLYATSAAVHGHNGLFWIPRREGVKPAAPFKVVVSDGRFVPPGTPRWEHVSVSLPSRCPTWEEMSRIKGVFWDDEDCVMQLHPPRSEWVNNHPYCLHLWRPIDAEIPRPPSFMVGITEREADAIFMGEVS